MTEWIAPTKRKPRFTAMQPGEKHGMLTAISLSHHISNASGWAWLFVCDCGVQKTARAADVRRGQIHSCGCANATAKRNLLGKKFGRWSVIKEAEQQSRHRWLCVCECGTKRIVLAIHLVRGKSQSCGCLAKDNPSNVKHGKTETAEYRIWCLMKGRCNNPNNPEYKRYGARGIRVCDRWDSSFENFLADMGERPTASHSIDRINVNGPYEIGNCRWATDTQQARNMRTNRLVVFNGVEMCLAEAAEKSGINYGTLQWRLDNDKPLFAEVRG